MSGAQGRISAGVGFNLIGQHTQERNQEATVYVGNLDPMVCAYTSAETWKDMLLLLYIRTVSLRYSLQIFKMS